jgi:hypothetical protein
MTEVNIFDLQCSFAEHDGKDKAHMTDKQLTDRLQAILLGCQDTLTQTKTLTDQYVSHSLARRGCCGFNNVHKVHSTRHELRGF